MSVRSYGHFFGVYLLLSPNSKSQRKTYIGFTVDPEKRLKQHNGGVESGGANKTNNKGPWEMVLIVHGFPQSIVALRFEWAWQNPTISRRLKHVVTRSHKSRSLEYDLDVLMTMLQVQPWKRLQLSIKWISKYDYPQKYLKVITVYKQHLRPFEKNYVVTNTAESVVSPECHFCSVSKQHVSSDEYFKCINNNCNGTFHVLCLANYFNTEETEVIPEKGNCPVCFTQMFWCDLVSRCDS